MDYSDVAELIIESQQDTIGRVALGRLRDLDFIEIDGQDYEFTKDLSRTDIEEILDTYKELQGKGAYGIARRSLKGELTADDNLDLPEEIVPEEVKEQAFVQGI
jgi:hypothetical protein